MKGRVTYIRGKTGPGFWFKRVPQPWGKGGISYYFLRPWAMADGPGLLCHFVARTDQEGVPVSTFSYNYLLFPSNSLIFTLSFPTVKVYIRYEIVTSN